MFEETNQTEEMMLPDELFTEEEMSEGIEEVAPEGELNAEETAGDDTPAPTVADVLRVKYNGEERDLPLDEARVLAQKGMNYDKILGERDELAGLIDEYANRSNMSRDQFMSYLKKALADQEDETAIANLRKAYPGASDDVLLELASRDRKIKDAEAKDRAAREKADAEAAAQQPWIDFFTRHPEVKPETLTPEFLKSVEEGMNPEVLYLTEKIAELEGNKAISAQNEKNMMSAVGSAKGDGSPTKRDLFLEGFNGV